MNMLKGTQTLMSKGPPRVVPPPEKKAAMLVQNAKALPAPTVATIVEPPYGNRSAAAPSDVDETGAAASASEKKSAEAKARQPIKLLGSPYAGGIVQKMQAMKAQNLARMQHLAKSQGVGVQQLQVEAKRKALQWQQLRQH